MDGAADDSEPSRILVAGTTDGHKVEVLQERDGTVSISFDGQPQPGFRWPVARLESCMGVFLGLLRGKEVLTPLAVGIGNAAGR